MSRRTGHVQWDYNHSADHLAIAVTIFFFAILQISLSTPLDNAVVGAILAKVATAILNILRPQIAAAKTADGLTTVLSEGLSRISISNLRPVFIKCGDTRS